MGVFPAFLGRCALSVRRTKRWRNCGNTGGLYNSSIANTHTYLLSKPYPDGISRLSSASCNNNHYFKALLWSPKGPRAPKQSGTTWGRCDSHRHVENRRLQLLLLLGAFDAFLLRPVPLPERTTGYMIERKNGRSISAWRRYLINALMSSSAYYDMSSSIAQRVLQQLTAGDMILRSMYC